MVWHPERLALTGSISLPSKPRLTLFERIMKWLTK